MMKTLEHLKGMLTLTKNINLLSTSFKNIGSIYLSEESKALHWFLKDDIVYTFA